jgi:hypothetical protein
LLDRSGVFLYPLYMSWFTDIFTAPQAASKLVDAAIDTGDALVYTDEEKAENNTKKLAFALEWLKQSSPQNLARRYIAVIIVIYFLIFLTITAIFLILIPSAGEILERLLEKYLYVPFSGIMAFYFMTHLLRAGKK